MKSFLVLVVASCCSIASAATLFYAGDYDGSENLQFHSGPFTGTNRWYEKFTLTTDSIVTSLYGNHFMSLRSSIPAEWAIRTGMGQGSGGTLIASASNVTASVSPTGRTRLGWNIPECRVSVDQLNLFLVAGTYWVSVRPHSDDSYISGTSGVNGVGSTVNDRISIVYNFGQNPMYQTYAYDWSFGVEGYAVPEPATILALGLGVVAISRRRRAID